MSAASIRIWPWSSHAEDSAPAPLTGREAAGSASAAEPLPTRNRWLMRDLGLDAAPDLQQPDHDVWRDRARWL
jgi:hypothetical protein